jgi:RNA polymerase sigma-32 factor
LQLYLQEVARHPLLDPAEEYELAVRHFEDGDLRAAHRLITSNLRLVVKIANDFRRAQENMLDLIQEGNYGLMQAVKRYNPYKGVKLSSYAAWWIRAYILKYLMDNKSLVKMGTTAAQRKLFFNLRKEAEKLLAEYDHVDPKLLASNLNVREKDVIEMQQRLAGPDMSLDEPVSEDSDVTRGALVAAQEESVEEILAKKEVQAIFKKHVEEFKKRLNGRDLELFEDRLLSVQPMTLQEFGDRYGVTRERARQIEARVMQKLKDFVREKGLT